MKDGRLLKWQIPYCAGGQEEKEKAGIDDDLGKPYFSQARTRFKTRNHAKIRCVHGPDLYRKKKLRRRSAFPHHEY